MTACTNIPSGVKLKSQRIGDRSVTTPEAVERFLAATAVNPETEATV